MTLLKLTIVLAYVLVATYAEVIFYLALVAFWIALEVLCLT